MTELDYLAVARFEGPDACSFLQAQFSADIAALAPGDATFSCYCSPRGQVFGLLLVCRDDDGFSVVGSRQLLPSIVQRLRMFVLRAGVEISNQPETRVTGLPTADEDTGRSAFQAAGLELVYSLSRSSMTAGSGDTVSWKAAELEQNVAWLGPETTEKFIPQMLGFDQIGAVSFSKGCFPGQEIIARARYLGKVKRKPLLVRLDEATEIPAGARVTLHRGEAKPGGIVVDSAALPGGAGLAFIVTAAEPAEEYPRDHPWQIEYDGRLYRCATR